MSTPSWLEEPTTTAPAPAATSLDAPPAPAADSRSTKSSATSSLEEDKDLPGVILMMRLANMGVAVALMANSILLMATLPSASNWVLAVYATCGGLLVCCLETQLKFLRVMIAINFGFLFSSVWRFFFYILLATVAWAYDNLFGKIVAAALVAVALFNTYVLCRYPSYRKIREKIAEEEDRRIEARISKEVRRQAVNSITSNK